MSFLDPRFPSDEAASISSTQSSMSTATITSSSPDGTSTIAPYNHGLNGVDQPMNMAFRDALWGTLGLLAVVILVVRLCEMSWSRLRHASAMTVPGDRQKYWKASQWSWVPGLKKNLIYAALWKKRHNREIKLSNAVSVGTLPSRLHTIILAIYLASNVAYMFVLNWGKDNHFSLVAEVRGRSGTLGVVNMVPLVIFAGRNNPLIHLLKVSFDTYNLMHRWIGRMIVAEIIVHICAWAYVQIADGGWGSIGAKITSQAFVASGMVGGICLVILVILSLGPIRHAFYETFLNTHIILALIIFITTYIHCVTADIGNLPQTSWVIGIAALWAADRAARTFRLAYFNWSARGFSEAMAVPLPGDATRVTMHLPRYIDIKPGSHAYLRFWGINPWETHPFSIAWVEHFPLVNKAANIEKADITPADYRAGTTSVSFVIGAHTGFTRALYNKASRTQHLHIRASMEGPYAGHHSLDSYGHVVLFAGATGITHQLSYIKPLIQGYADGTVATRRITLIWIIRDYEALEWIRPWMDEILHLPRRREILNIKLFITRPKHPTEIQSASNTVHMFPGRPNTPVLLRKEVEGQVGAMCVTVCGPGALADDVRQAVRECQDELSVIDFIEESFTW